MYLDQRTHVEEQEVIRYMKKDSELKEWVDLYETRSGIMDKFNNYG